MLDRRPFPGVSRVFPKFPGNGGRECFPFPRTLSAGRGGDAGKRETLEAIPDGEGCGRPGRRRGVEGRRGVHALDRAGGPVTPTIIPTLSRLTRDELAAELGSKVRGVRDEDEGGPRYSVGTSEAGGVDLEPGAVFQGAAVKGRRRATSGAACEAFTAGVLRGSAVRGVVARSSPVRSDHRRSDASGHGPSWGSIPRHGTGRPRPRVGGARRRPRDQGEGWRPRPRRGAFGARALRGHVAPSRRPGLPEACTEALERFGPGASPREVGALLAARAGAVRALAAAEPVWSKIFKSPEWRAIEGAIRDALTGLEDDRLERLARFLEARDVEASRAGSKGGGS